MDLSLRVAVLSAFQNEDLFVQFAPFGELYA